MRAAPYTRISDDKADGAGVERQEKECRELAARHGWDVVKVFSDNDVSAYDGRRRPGYEAMLKGMAAGEFDVLVCWHTDRLYRSPVDLERLITIADKAGVMIRTVNSGELDLSTSAGRMVARILGSVHRQESEHHAERRKLANRERALAGGWNPNGHRTFGFEQDGSHREAEAALIRKAVADVLSGESLRAIARRWNGAGITTVKGKPWTNLFIKRVLTNPRLAGIRVHQGVVLDVPGAWKPIVEPDLYHQLMELLGDPKRRGAVSFERRYLGSGVYICGQCGQRMYAGSPGRGRPLLYCCRPSNHVTRQAAALDEYVEMVVVEYLREGGVGQGLRERTKQQVDLAARRAALRGDRDVLVKRRDRLFGLHVEGTVTEAQLQRGTEELRARIAGIDSQLGELAVTDPLAGLLTYEKPADAELLVQRWEQASVDVRGKIIGKLMDVVVLPRPRGTRGFDSQYVELRWK